MEGRFTLGVGTGEALNEHILGDAWPSTDIRLEMLEEAVALIRELWTGEVVTHKGEYYRTDTARIYTRPDEPPPIFMSGFGPKATAMAARIADGYITTSPDQDLLDMFRKENDGPTQAGFKVAHAPTEDEGVELAHTLWGHTAIPGEVGQVLPSPQQFEALGRASSREDTRRSVACGNDADRQLDAFRPFLDAGFDEVYVANIGPHFEQMIRQFGATVLPAVRELAG
jgi:G6PDH family F420-dependent oxidoreductase